MTRQQDLDGKVILITGAARGIGAQLARLAARRGARLALAGLEPELLAALARELGPEHAWFECDVTDQAAVERAVRGTRERFGGIDVVVANAGIANNGSVMSNPIEAQVRTIEVNLIGVMRTVKAALPSLIERQGYCLIVSSVAAFPAVPGMSAYAASKAGVEHFGNSLRLEVRHRGVAVGTAHPSWIDTDLVRDQQKDLQSFNEAMRRMPVPLGRVTSLDECAQALLEGIVRRSRRIYVPRSLMWIQVFRSFFVSGVWDGFAGRVAGELIPKVEQEVAALGRHFGGSSVEARKSAKVSAK